MQKYFTVTIPGLIQVNTLDQYITSSACPITQSTLEIYQNSYKSHCLKLKRRQKQKQTIQYLKVVQYSEW